MYEQSMLGEKCSDDQENQKQGKKGHRLPLKKGWGIHFQKSEILTNKNP